MHKVFFKQDVEIFENRQEAIDKMVEESEEDDILYLGGRGDNSNYQPFNNSIKYFTDYEYIQSKLEERYAKDNG